MTAPRFAALFGRAVEVTASAPGRVNLIGEHTDYSGGFVLPTAIPQRTVAELARRPDRLVRAASDDLGGGVQTFELGAETPGRGWVDYVQGVTGALAAAGHALAGFDLRLASEVPVGAGLSSSAALEVALLRALREAFGLRLDDVALAVAGQRAECDFVGAPVGIMDQLASSLAAAGEALFVDTRSLAYERVPIPPAMELVVIDSGVKHSHATGGYRARRAEVERAAALLRVNQLRDLGPADAARIEALPEPLRRRARHVVTENGRVLAMVEALRAGDAAGAGALLRAGHASLRDDFEVSTPEIDALVELAGAERALLGARLTGGGFGGSVVALCAEGEGAPAGARLASRYRQRTGRSARVLVPARA